MRLAGWRVWPAISPLTRKRLRKAVWNARRPLFDPDVWPLRSPQEGFSGCFPSPEPKSSPGRESGAFPGCLGGLKETPPAAPAQQGNGSLPPTCLDQIGSLCRRQRRWPDWVPPPLTSVESNIKPAASARSYSSADTGKISRSADPSPLPLVQEAALGAEAKRTPAAALGATWGCRGSH